MIPIRFVVKCYFDTIDELARDNESAKDNESARKDDQKGMLYLNE